ncbi:alpha-2-macroglobulin family protein [Flavihumibacter fluvii]|uniref:alpha-2-macroglobulin family protein n=1 Tax=Flavihumibacter fluvii TaxID=2838157 RepID=UPI001BDDD913|nr:alpha-2-macroglobulin family protein [Flavihumibacter fluvii]ULQ52822.1 MG2 domain-containing protein [Flavihumibacter fluvii]
MRQTTGILIFFFISVFFSSAIYAQNMKPANYTSWWTRIDSLVQKKGLYRSALTEVNKLYKKAVAEKQEAQQIKALVYRMELQEQLEEFSDTLVIAAYKKASASTKGATSAIFHSLLADYYNTYYNNHRWELYDQTATRNYQKENIRSWGVADFHEAISNEFTAALKEATVLQHTDLTRFDPVIEKGNVRQLRPTLYDLIAWKALDYYMQGREGENLAEDAFTLQSEKLLAPAAEFSQHRFKAEQPGDHYFKAVQLYQDILKFHLSDKNPAALLDADLSRISYMHDNGIMAGKKSAYQKALEDIHKRYEGTAGADQAAYLLARSYMDKEPADYVRALAICEKVTLTKKDSEGYANCYNLLQEIRQPSLDLTIEKVNLPGQPFRSLTGWRNLQAVHFRLVRINEGLRKSLFEDGRYFDTAEWQLLLKENPIKAWEQNLPSTNDYQKHSVELKVDGLPIGEYILLAGSNNDFNLDNTHLAAARFHVSNISYVKRGNDFFFLHRASGQPLAKAGVQTWLRQYDYQTRKNIPAKGSRYITSEEGYLHFNDLQKSSNLLLEVNYKDDRLFLEDEEYLYMYSPTAEKSKKQAIEALKYARVFFFTDRSIYRPGQTLYFKGIAITRDADSKKNKVYAGIPTVVNLYNANGEKIDSVKVFTNLYGSYSGSFNIPETGLTGGFRLEDPMLHGQAGFRVEEYKRPKFFVEYEQQKGTYRVNDSVTVKGFAKAYAGNVINGASLTYRVTRNARFLYPWRAYWKPMPKRASQEITHGKLVTAADGSFSIPFLAIPDEQLDKSTDPVFDYEVSVDVTDLNGETRSASTIIPVSYKALQVKIGIPAQVMALDSFRQFSITTQNISGSFEAAKVNVSILPLLSPGRLVRNRLWAKPDQYIFTEKEFVQYFPNDEYATEADPASWKTGTEIWNTTITTAVSGKLPVDLNKPGAGWYKVIATTVDRYGDTVKDFATVYLVDTRARQLPVPAYLTTLQDKQVLQPGETAHITLGSSAGKVYVIQQRENASYDPLTASQVSFSGKFTIQGLDNSILNESLTATEGDRGGMAWMHFFVKDNRFYSVQHGIAVPWLNMELDIEVSSYRDKTLPGSEEKWSVRIKGNKGEKVAAELLTSMYDASLDQFAPHQWSLPSLWPLYWNRENWEANVCFTNVGSINNAPVPDLAEVKEKDYDELITARNQGFERSMLYEKSRITMAAPMADDSKKEVIVSAYSTKKKGAPGDGEKNNEEITGSKIVEPVPLSNSGTATRKDFRETAFFFPQLQADTEGQYTFSFTMPEALTTWKWQILAHSADLSMGTLQKTILTQKELMVQPNMPRFLREGDRLEVTTKVVNLSDKEMTGQAELQLIDATTNQPIDGWFNNFFPNQYFTVAAGSSEVVKFPVEVPFLFDKVLTYKIIARSGNFSDGEEAVLPVLSNRQLVTESLPFYINGSGIKNYDFKKLTQSGGSETLSNRSLTVEYTSNPAWYAVQALTYLADYPYECAEQSFNRLYGNLLAASIVDRLPRIRSILEQWNTKDTSALLSNLQKNQGLKQVLLEETPWVLAAKSEAAQKRNIAQLFNLVQLAANRSKLAAQLVELQAPNGGFSWFKGGPDDRYITQYIVTGIGHLKQLGVLPKDLPQLMQIVDKALPYLDARIKEDYDRRDKKTTTVNHLNYYAVQYHYMRSFFPEKGIAGTILPAANHYRKEIQQNWIKGNRMARGMIALALFRTGDKFTAESILKSLEQSAIIHDELGMYWKDNVAAYYWQDAPIETQALLIEAFSAIRGNDKTVGALKTWLLRNKQTNHWTSTKSTADACYALLLKGDNWLEAEPVVSVQLGTNTTVRADKTEAGSGYYQKQIPGTGVFPEMGKITLNVQQAQGANTQQPVWGAVYWQYFESLEKITASAGPLRLKKQVMVQKASKAGPVLEPVGEGATLQVGDKVTVRIELTTDRSMEYVHVKDMRASSLEPVSVLSSYKWQGGLGYYESTRDASTNFFISYLPKGTYVMEYGLFVSHAGVFSNGISTVQCMYAPEFTSHSEGIKISVE